MTTDLHQPDHKYGIFFQGLAASYCFLTLNAGSDVGLKSKVKRNILIVDLKPCDVPRGLDPTYFVKAREVLRVHAPRPVLTRTITCRGHVKKLGVSASSCTQATYRVRSNKRRRRKRSYFHTCNCQCCMPPKISIRKAGGRKKGEDTDSGSKKVGFEAVAVQCNWYTYSFSRKHCCVALQTASAPKRAKRTNSRKRFHEDEGYEEAEVMVSWVKHTCCTRLVYAESWANKQDLSVLLICTQCCVLIQPTLAVHAAAYRQRRTQVVCSECTLLIVACRSPLAQRV